MMNSVKHDVWQLGRFTELVVPNGIPETRMVISFIFITFSLFLFDVGTSSLCTLCGHVWAKTRRDSLYALSGWPVAPWLPHVCSTPRRCRTGEFLTINNYESLSLNPLPGDDRFDLNKMLFHLPFPKNCLKKKSQTCSALELFNFLYSYANGEIRTICLTDWPDGTPPQSQQEFM